MHMPSLLLWNVPQLASNEILNLSVLEYRASSLQWFLPENKITINFSVTLKPWVEWYEKYLEEMIITLAPIKLIQNQIYRYST